MNTNSKDFWNSEEDEQTSRRGYYDATRGTIVYGNTYGEYSFNGLPMYPRPIDSFLKLLRLPKNDPFERRSG